MKAFENEGFAQTGNMAQSPHHGDIKVSTSHAGGRLGSGTEQAKPTVKVRSVKSVHLTPAMFSKPFTPHIYSFSTGFQC